jgi:hypothetical protein
VRAELASAAPEDSEQLSLDVAAPTIDLITPSERVYGHASPHSVGALSREPAVAHVVLPGPVTHWHPLRSPDAHRMIRS